MTTELKLLTKIVKELAHHSLTAKLETLTELAKILARHCSLRINLAIVRCRIFYLEHILGKRSNEDVIDDLPF